MLCPLVNSAFCSNTLRAKWVIVQNKNIMVKALASADIIFTSFGCIFGPAKQGKHTTKYHENRRAREGVPLQF